MTNEEKIEKIQSIIDQSDERGIYSACYKFLEDTGDLKTNYHDYLTTGPIDCDIELQRLTEADYELSTALLTMILREDRFVDYAFHMRYEKGQVEEILRHMIQTLA